MSVSFSRLSLFYLPFNFTRNYILGGGIELQLCSYKKEILCCLFLQIGFVTAEWS